jgi:hypothetical protein
MLVVGTTADGGILTMRGSPFFVNELDPEKPSSPFHHGELPFAEMREMVPITWHFERHFPIGRRFPTRHDGLGLACTFHWQTAPPLPHQTKAVAHQPDSVAEKSDTQK